MSEDMNAASPQPDPSLPADDHPDLEAIADHAAGVGDAAVGAHIDRCPDCRARLTDVTAGTAAVAAELAALPTPPLPAGLLPRIEAALGAAAAERAVPPPETGAAGSGATEAPPPGEPVAPVTPAAPVEPFAPARGNVVAVSTAPSFWRRHGGVLAGSAAAAVVIALVTVITIGHFRDGTSSPSGVAAIAERTTALVTTSGVNYSTKNLGAAVPALLAHRAPGAAGPAAQDESATSGGQAASPTTPPSPATRGGGTAGGANAGPAFAAVPVASLPPALTALKTDPLALQQCLVNLEASPAAPPIAVDLGQWNGQPAAVFVFPNPTRPDKVSIIVAAAGCPPGSFLFFGNFDKP